MLKLILPFALIASCIALPFAGSAGAGFVSSEAPSFEEVFIAPELEQPENCKSADLDIFFYDRIVTAHSAEYVGEAVSLSSTCDETEYLIQPIAEDYYTDSQVDEVLLQAAELLAILDANGAKAKITEVRVQTSSDNLTLNGRAAILNIEIKDTERA